MVEFNLWREAFILAIVFGIIITISCVLLGIIGTKMIDQMGRYPSKAPVIQLSIVGKLILIEIFAFGSLMIFYNVFS